MFAHRKTEYLMPLFFALWSAVIVAAVWRFWLGVSDPTAALIAGAVFVLSLALSRFVFQLRLSTAPMLYLALCGLFHLGVAVPWALGIYDISRTPGFSPFGISRALALITCAIAVYQLGLIVGLRAKAYEFSTGSNFAQNLQDSNIFWTGVGVFSCGAAMFLIGLLQLEKATVDRLTYSETFRLRAETDPRFFGTGITLGFIGLCLAAAGASRRNMRFAYVCLGLWFSALFFLGFRSPAITGVLVVYAVAVKKDIRFPRWAPWLGIAILLVAVPVMRVIRESPLERGSVVDSFREINLLDGPAEVGGSIRPLAETIDAIGSGPFRHGRTYLNAMKNIVPNLAFHWQAPEAQSIDDLTPNHWITALVDPWAYANHEGMGFSAIAEPYMNFGMAGVIVYFFALAILLVRLEQVSIRTPYGLAVWALLIGPLLWTTRNDSSEFFRPVAWGLLCLGAVSVLSRRYRSKTAAESPSADQKTGVLQQI